MHTCFGYLWDDIYIYPHAAHTHTHTRTQKITYAYVREDRSCRGHCLLRDVLTELWLNLITFLPLPTSHLAAT